ncbi:MAG: hypothetical protein C4K58_00070 [Flavobacteriaceae bacterium]|nr:MAG: hypothetical protein C4K58_00070 [Flavobacteriaceae bacterium]
MSNMKTIFQISLAILLFFVVSCAKVSTPTGGEIDKTGPRLLQMSLENFSTQVQTDLKLITFDFDEFVSLGGKESPVVTPNGASISFSPKGMARKYVEVKFGKPLLENTTYTINFGKSIVDNNEKNPMDSTFIFVFSTGKSLDSLKLSGTVSSLLDKEPSKNLKAHLYKAEGFNLDSLQKNTPMYVSEIKENTYQFQYLSNLPYKLVVFEDQNQNASPDLDQEKFAIYPNPIDLNLNNQLETLVLSKGKTSGKKAVLAQTGAGVLSIKPGIKPEEIKSISGLEKENLTFGYTLDSLSVWFNPKNSSLKPGENIEILTSLSDTLKVKYQNLAPKPLSCKEESNPGFPLSGFTYSCNAPLINIREDSIKFENKTEDLPQIKTRINPQNPTQFFVELSSYTKAQTLVFGKNALESVFGGESAGFKLNAPQINPNSLGQLQVSLTNTPDSPFWIELYPENITNSRALQSNYGKLKEVSYKDLKPGKYTLIVKIDQNQNGVWDLQDPYLNTPTEPVIVLPKTLEVRALWEIKEIWDLSVEKQKPTEKKGNLPSS